jgi:hypothetical protein
MEQNEMIDILFDIKDPNFIKAIQGIEIEGKQLFYAVSSGNLNVNLIMVKNVNSYISLSYKRNLTIE